jgi:chaperonin GroES
MKRGAKDLLVVGDRVLIEPGAGESVTKVGLVLPASALDKDDVRSGTIVALGPGTPLPPPNDDAEPWKQTGAAARFLPMQAELGDYALFFRKAAIEIDFEGQKFLVVPYGAILVLVRNTKVPDRLPEGM